MEQLLTALYPSSEYQALSAAVRSGSCAALSGLSPITRAHVIASLFRESGRPHLVLCQDEPTARTMQEMLHSFLGQEIDLLPARDLTFGDAAAVSRGWEQKRLRQLYRLASGETRILVTSLQALTMRTVPKATLLSTALPLAVMEPCEVGSIADRLTELGYSRGSLVEGPGQFALRGGILDVFSPAASMPVRVEFFGDEVDIMGYFDPVTQRRTENVDAITILPVAETLPGLHPDGADGLAAAIEGLIARQKRKKQPNELLLKTLITDLERLQNHLTFAAWDRYQALIYPEFACAADYLPPETVVCFCDHGSLQKMAKTQEEELRMSLQALLEAGLVDGSLSDFQLSWDRLSLVRGKASMLSTW